MIMQIITT